MGEASEEFPQELTDHVFPENGNSGSTRLPSVAEILMPMRNDDKTHLQDKRCTMRLPELEQKPIREYQQVVDIDMPNLNHPGITAPPQHNISDAADMTQMSLDSIVNDSVPDLRDRQAELDDLLQDALNGESYVQPMEIPALVNTDHAAESVTRKRSREDEGLEHITRISRQKINLCECPTPGNVDAEQRLQVAMKNYRKKPGPEPLVPHPAAAIVLPGKNRKNILFKSRVRSCIRCNKTWNGTKKSVPLRYEQKADSFA